jgi:transcriptional regulator with XRE-family HTH domain
VSDLYLILRRRLDHVTDWVMVETDVLREARKRLGLSYEAVARQLYVSSKTYERWEKAGRIPRPVLPRVAEILKLQIEREGQPPLALAVDDELSREIIARLDRIETLLRNQLAS